MKSVELKASGYEWICPTCHEINREIEITEQVTCSHCTVVCKVEDYSHATDVKLF